MSLGLTHHQQQPVQQQQQQHQQPHQQQQQQHHQQQQQSMESNGGVQDYMNGGNVRNDMRNLTSPAPPGATASATSNELMNNNSDHLLSPTTGPGGQQPQQGNWSKVLKTFFPE